MKTLPRERGLSGLYNESLFKGRRLSTPHAEIASRNSRAGSRHEPWVLKESRRSESATTVVRASTYFASSDSSESMRRLASCSSSAVHRCAVQYLNEGFFPSAPGLAHLLTLSGGPLALPYPPVPTAPPSTMTVSLPFLHDYEVGKGMGRP